MEELFLSVADEMSPIFRSGRQLAAQAYREMWGTASLSNSHFKYGVVIQDSKGRALANMNIQDLAASNRLDSERYFGIRHWHDFPNAEGLLFDGICEYSGMAIHHDLRGAFRNNIFQLLVGKSLLFSISHCYTALSTIQRPPLIGKLSGALGLPFASNASKAISGSTPNDRYWRGSAPPCLYYLDLQNKATFISAVNMCQQAKKSINVTICSSTQREIPCREKA